MTWSDFGQAGWMNEVTRLLKDLHPVMDRAAAVIESSLFKLEGLPMRRATGLTTLVVARWRSA